MNTKKSYDKNNLMFVVIYATSFLWNSFR